LHAKNRAFALLVDLRSTITAGFTVELGIARAIRRVPCSRGPDWHRTAHGL